MPRIGPLIGLIGLSPAPVGVQISPYTQQFRVSRQRIADAEDSVAERNGFELSVPISKLTDDNFQATFLQRSDETKIKRGRAATGIGISG
jgi:hypothetical protein